MQHFSITLTGAGALDGVYRDVAATEVDTAVKRVLSGIEAAKIRGLKPAAARQVSGDRLRLPKGGKISIVVSRF